MKQNSLKKAALVLLFIITAGLCFGLTNPTYTTGSPVYTPKGTAVATLRCTLDYTSAEKTAINNYYAGTFSSATLVSSSTAKYNCHSYAWYSTSTANNRWINNPLNYYNDGSYKYRGSTGITSDKVFYVNAGYVEHSAIKTSSTLFTSKWGQGPVMRHSPSYSPYGGSLYYFYR